MSEEEYRGWLEASEIDVKAAQATLQAGVFSACVFHCQQAVEKRLKGLVAWSGKPRFTHSLTDLIEGVVGSFEEIPAEVKEALAELDLHYIQSRYPGITSLKKLYSEKKAKEAIEWMQQVFQFLDNLHMT